MRSEKWEAGSGKNEMINIEEELQKEIKLYDEMHALSIQEKELINREETEALLKVL